MISQQSVRLLFLSDSHLGFDMPIRKRVAATRRGEDFFRAFDEALKPAFEGNADVVLHGGDLFFRSRIPAWLSREVLKRIQVLSNRGIPFCFVPGNHERSHIPHPILWCMEHVHVFEEPKTIELEVGGVTLAVSGFPFFRGNVRTHFRSLLEATGYHGSGADIRVLLMHQIVEGAVVGPAGYCFRSGPQVIRAMDISRDFVVIFAGHVHRHQILTTGMTRGGTPCSVVYAGSTERTSFAERDETKGYIMAELGKTGNGRGELCFIDFHPIRSRRMYVRRICMEEISRDTDDELAASLFDDVDEYGILRIEVSASPSGNAAVRRIRNLIRNRPPGNLIVEIRRRYGESPDPRVRSDHYERRGAVYSPQGSTGSP